MNDPTEALRKYIEDNYALTDAGITKGDIIVTDVDYNTETSPLNPHIIVQLSGFRRQQPEEPHHYDFTFIISVAVFTKFRKFQADRADVKALYWKIVDHLKFMFDNFQKNDIAGWDYTVMEQGANVGITLDTIPETYLFNCTVKACVRWTA
jgi:hypothetical protein